MIRLHALALAGLIAASAPSTATASPDLLPAIPRFTASPPPLPPDSPYIRYRVDIDAPSALKDAIEPALDISRWQDYASITPELLERLARAAVDEAREALATEGYFSPEIAMKIDASDPVRVVRLTINPGEPTRIASVSITFTGTIAGRRATDGGADDDREDPRGEARMADVRAAWLLPEKAIFRQKAWDNAKSQAVKALSSVHYAAARIVRSEARVDPDTRQAALAVELDSGPPFRFGDIDITGTVKYQETRVRELAPFHRGDLYTRELLDRFQRRLTATGYFASMQLAIDDKPEQAAAAPVRVALIEAPTKRLEVSLGYSTDALLRGSFTWRDNNLAGSGWRLRSELRMETDTQGAGVAIDRPEQAGHGDTFGTKVERENNNNLLTEQFAVAALRTGLDERNQPQYGVRYVFERQYPLGAPADTTFATLFLYGRTWRTTDALLSPRDGLVTQAEIGIAPPGLSSRQFGRVIGKVAWFRPLGRAMEFNARFQAGAVIASSSSGIPQEFLFRTGGDTTVRGYSFESIGVKQGDAIVGGRYLAIGTAEVIRWVREGLGVAVFLDAGNATDKPAELKPKLGYGIGGRVRSPIGPLRLDIAYGNEVRDYRVHFSAGLTF